MELKNAVCIVTGSASGIGAASAIMVDSGIHMGLIPRKV